MFGMNNVQSSIEQKFSVRVKMNRFKNLTKMHVLDKAADADADADDLMVNVSQTKEGDENSNLGSGDSNHSSMYQTYSYTIND